MSKITINGKTFVGNNISIKNSKIMIDGVEVVSPSEKEINIEIHGNVEQINVDVCEEIKVNGDVKILKTTSGDVDATGNVGTITTTSGDVKCGDVEGSVTTISGDVTCKTLYGGASTVSGDINRN